MLAATTVVVALLGGLLSVTPAAAHSFLVSTAPAQGDRLAAAPDAIVLDFSERVDRSTVEIRLDTAGGDRLALGSVALAEDGLVVRVPLPEALDDGIYVVGWQALSAVDGHGTFGEFAFGVGRIDGSVPAATSSSSTSPWTTTATLLFVVGFALAAGRLTVAWLDGAALGPRRWVRIGLLAASVGSAGAWWERFDGRSSEGFLAAALTLGLLSLTMSVHSFARRPGPPLALLLAAAAAWSARSHAATAEGVVGAAVDLVHLAAGGIWAGALVVVALRLWGAHRRGGDWHPLAARYSKLALVLVVVLAHAGVVSAVLLVPTWDDLWSTGYGRLLVVKTFLFAVAVVLASVGRWGGLARHRLSLLRTSTSVEVMVLLAVLVVAGLLANVSPPAPAGAAEALLGPPPLHGPVTRDAGLAGQLNVEVAADGSRLDIRVFSPSGPLPGTDIAVSVSGPDDQGADLLPRPCGTGCFTQQLELGDGTTSLTVTASAPEWTGGRFDARLHWPAGPEAPDRLREVITTTRAIPRLTVTELVDSGPGSVTNENSFEMTGDALIDAEPYAGGNVTDVRLLPGRPERLSLYVPGSQIYAVLVLDDHGRMVSSHLISPGHDIRRQFSYPPT